MIKYYAKFLHSLFSSSGSRAQFWALAASMKLSVSFRLLNLGQSAGLLGRVISSSQGLCVSCPGWSWGWRSWWNEWFWQGKLKYSEKTFSDATLSTTNPTYQTRTRTRAAAVGSQRLTASAMARPPILSYQSNISCRLPSHLTDSVAAKPDVLRK
jgi:hypothetical protein